MLETYNKLSRVPKSKEDISQLKRENEALKTQLAQAERISADNALSNQELLEALIDKGVL